ncbi:MAG: ribonuclease III [Eubacteriaceae bacterium]|nr:ribonuclease III [Eubacteriaceae bacterium]
MTRNDFQSKTGYVFKDAGLLEQAVTHSSYTREKNLPRAECNERLEFLGDAFFDAIIGEELYDRLPSKKEGYLTKYRALVVCENSLAEMGRRLGVGEMLKLGKGEEMTGGRNRESIIADAMEAIIGAIYKDSGYDRTKELVLGLFAQRINDAVSGKLHTDYKSEFQEKMQSRGPVQIQYVLVDEEGPDHAKIFYVKVLVNDVVYGQGKGHSKKEAEQNAAREAILRGEKYVL